MTQDEIIEMARQAGFKHPNPHDGYMGLAYDRRDGADTGPSLEAFAQLVASKEREACALVCEEISLRASGIHDAMTDDRNDEPILYMTGKELGSKSCADAIRARAQAERGEA